MKVEKTCGQSSLSEDGSQMASRLEIQAGSQPEVTDFDQQHTLDQSMLYLMQIDTEFTTMFSDIHASEIFICSHSLMIIHHTQGPWGLAQILNYLIILILPCVARR